jgi:hypothetical protein
MRWGHRAADVAHRARLAGEAGFSILFVFGMVAKRIGALVNAPAVAKLALQQHLPSIGWLDYAIAHGLMAYGIDFVDLFRRAATLVDRS